MDQAAEWVAIINAELDDEANDESPRNDSEERMGLALPVKEEAAADAFSSGQRITRSLQLVGATEGLVIQNQEALAEDDGPPSPRVDNEEVSLLDKLEATFVPGHEQAGKEGKGHNESTSHENNMSHDEGGSYDDKENPTDEQEHDDVTDEEVQDDEEKHIDEHSRGEEEEKKDEETHEDEEKHDEEQKHDDEEQHDNEETPANEEEQHDEEPLANKEDQRHKEQHHEEAPANEEEHNEEDALKADEDAIPEQSRERAICNACLEPTDPEQLFKAPCSHHYCHTCLARLFQDATIDESLFPPRCCRQRFPFEIAATILTREQYDHFLDKGREFATVNRTYCYSRWCGAFIPPPRCGREHAICFECYSWTCTLCKNGAHKRGECPEDSGLQKVLGLAKAQGWQRCEKCGGIVELRTGCNHMTCRCSHEFCYLCGKQWKTCDCDTWDEARLLQRAEQIDAQNQPRPNAQQPRQQRAGQPLQAAAAAAAAGNPPAQAQAQGRIINAAAQRHNTLDPNTHDWVAPLAALHRQRVRQIMRDLRDNHECDHLDWHFRHTPRACEQCGDYMPIFIFECMTCHVSACRRCKDHRL